MKFFFLATLFTSCVVSTRGIVTKDNGNTRISWYGNTGVDVTTAASFVKLQEIPLGDRLQFFAQPLVYDDVIFAASINNTIHRINAKTHEILESRLVDPPFDAWRELGTCVSPQNPYTGILSTPVIDRDIIYFTSKTYKDGTTSGLDNGVWKLHALDFYSWQKKPGFPIVISGEYNGVVFNGGEQLQRPGLLSMNGKIIVTFGAYCSLFDYHGWVFAIDRESGSIDSVFATSTTDPTTRGGGVWMAGSAPSTRGDGTFYTTSGNSFGNWNYSSLIRGRYAITSPLVNSIIRFNVSTGKPIDFFTPSNTVDLDAKGLDLGTGSLALLPSQFDFKQWQTGATLGKDGYMFIVKTLDLGGYAGEGKKEYIIQKIQTGGASRCTPSAFPPDKLLYVSVFNKGIQAYEYSSTTGKFTLKGRTQSNVGINVGNVVVTSSASITGTAAIWINDVNTAQIRAYKGTPVNGTIVPILAIPAKVCKFTSPTFYKSRGYVTTCDGKLVVFGKA
ncbi:hypothetical protein BC832DRAFT_206321 [Gaertneriomyces semiglobifer]|nr:hypothetical protein BC832DRAFT_206321 [Gaertneriomyces semiglobifer]